MLVTYTNVSFENAIVIMTSNVGSQHIADMAPLGFVGNADSAAKEGVKDKVMEALKERFRPEFLNRVDETILFNYLAKKEIGTIVDLEVSRIAKIIYRLTFWNNCQDQNIPLGK